MIQNKLHVFCCQFFRTLSNTPILEKKKQGCMEVRLNSPCGKFKITYMPDDQVDLTPADIPGLSIIEQEIEKLTVAQVVVKMSLNKSRW